MAQLKITPKAFANFSPELERSDNSGKTTTTIDSTLKGFGARGTLSGFNAPLSYEYPGFSLRSNPGLQLVNAFGVNPGLKLVNPFGVIFELSRYKRGS